MTTRSSNPSRLIAPLIAFLLAPPLAAQPQIPTAPADDNPFNLVTTPQPLHIAGYWENDSNPIKFNNNRDRHYTNGIAVAVAHRPDWAVQIAPFIPFHNQFVAGAEPDQLRTAAGYTAGQLMFTPEELTTSEFIPDDQPYAGYLYAGVYWERARYAGPHATADRFRFDLGVVGPLSLADELQQSIHSWVDTDFPEGWSNQLNDELTFQFYVDKKWRTDIGQLAFDTPRTLDVIPQVTLALGTVYRHLESSLTFRAGWNLPDDFGPASIADPASGLHLGATPDSRWSLYGFARVSARIVEHDLFIEGNTFSDGPSLDPELVMAQATLGIAFAYHFESWSIEASYSQTFQTDRFEDQGTGDEFAALSLAATFRF